MDMDNLATELLHQIKLNAKRWFIAFLVMVGIEVATIAGFMWYISLPVEECSIEQTTEETENSTVIQRIGDTYGESDTKVDIQEKSSSE